MTSKFFHYLPLGLMVLLISACTSVPKPAVPMSAPEGALTRNENGWVMDRPLASFSDYILIKNTENGPVRVTLEEMIPDLAQFDVVFVGEAHGHAANHYLQSRIFSGLYRLNPQLSLSMEQFERPAQTIVDDYLQGKIGEETLVFEGKAWPHYRSSYRPLVEFARHKKLPVIAAEVPGNLVSCIGERGPDFLNHLEEPARGWVAQQLHLDDGPYRQRFYAFMDQAAGHSVDEGISEEQKTQQKYYRYAAQAARDDTMAESIARHLQSHQDRKIMHINGSFHSARLLGTPERVALRLPGVTMANIHPVLVENPDRPSFSTEDLAEGRYLMLLYPVPPRFVQMKNINAFIARTKSAIDKDRCAY